MVYLGSERESLKQSSLDCRSRSAAQSCTNVQQQRWLCIHFCIKHLPLPPQHARSCENCKRFLKVSFSYLDPIVRPHNLVIEMYTGVMVAYFEGHLAPYAGRMVQPNVSIHSRVEEAGFGPVILTMTVLSEGIPRSSKSIRDSASFMSC